MLRIPHAYRLFITISDVRPGAVGARSWIGLWLLKKLAILKGSGDGGTLVEMIGFGLVVRGARKRGELIRTSDF